MADLERPPRFDIAAHVGHVKRSQARAGTSSCSGSATSCRTGSTGGAPLWEMALVDGLAGGRWALATKTHHCLVDGMGSVDVGQILLDAGASPPRHRPSGHWNIAPHGLRT